MGFKLVEPMKEGTYEAEYSTIADDGTLEDKSGEFKADFGTIEVPENRRDPETRAIKLPIIRIRATGEKPAEPIFWFAGGPGQSNMETFQFDYFLPNHDHVMVGYRGVDGSVSLDCKEVIGVLADAKDVLTDETLARVGDAYAACAERHERNGVDIDGYTTLDVVEDMEAARKALGYGQIDLVAESYGTRLAYLYGVRYPDSINRTAMIGANPPGGMVWDPQKSDELIKRYGELWAKDPEASARCPDLVDAIREVNDDMPRRWLFLPIHPGNVKAAAFSVLSERETAAMVFDTYCAAANGDPSGLWLASLVARFVFPEVVNWGNNASKAVSADYDPSRDYAEEMVPEDAVMGEPLGRFLWGPAGRWPIEPMPEEYRRLQDSDVETLILSGNLDFTTPADNAKEDLLPHLPNGRQVVVSEMGHIGDLWEAQPKATRRILTSFLDTGVPDDSLYRYEPMDFSVRWGYPTQAKLIVGGVLLAAIALVSIAWLALRFVRGRVEDRRGGNPT